jgi:hypothetical protein
MPEDMQPVITYPNITYTIGNYVEGDNFVEVTYTNSEGFIYKKMVNIPYLEIGQYGEGESSIDQPYFQEILEGQLMGVINKLRMGLITFVDPNENVGIGTSV